MHSLSSLVCSRWRRWACTPLLLALCLPAGCSRSYYRRRADQDSYSIIQEKSWGRPWQIPADFSIVPDPQSRLFDATNPDDPLLPPPTPKLYAYQLRVATPGGGQSPTATGSAGSALARTQGPAGPATTDGWRAAEPPASEPAAAVGASHGHVVAAGWTSSRQPRSADQQVPAAGPQRSRQRRLGRVRPIPTAAWERIPASCLARMFEFASVRTEYRNSFDRQPPAELRDTSPRLSLTEIVQQALLNSRDYQAQKENLYRAALALTFERYEYDLKFSPSGSGTNLTYNHQRSGGNTVNSLSVNSALSAEKLLATGGNFLAKFANDVILTFNGPQGFAADISSELFFKLSQNLLQRDRLLEPLIQSERNVVYAAQQYARFRKTFFFERASQYYNLIRNYRQIEIDAQNYFSLVRALDQAEYEERAGLQSRIQVEQIEQQMWQGLSTLINTCNRLESGLDSLKLSMGLPVETPMNLDLSELDELTLADEIEVEGERVRRAGDRLRARLEKKPAAEAELRRRSEEIVNGTVVLVERLLGWLRLRRQLGQSIPDLDPLQLLYARLRVEEARFVVDRDNLQLQQALKAVPPAPPISLFQTTMDLLEDLYDLQQRQLELAATLGKDQKQIAALRAQADAAADQSDQLHEALSAVLEKAQLEQIPQLLDQANQLLKQQQGRVQAADKLTGLPPKKVPPQQELQQAADQAQQLLARSRQLLQKAKTGLVPVQIGVDDAMMTALTQRLDLMSERGQLADKWRAIKLAADELRSVLNFQATEKIRTEKNRPFGFTFDNSETVLGFTFDLPLNRRAQRNAFRLSLIDYQGALRELTELEDRIKQSVRDELRGLALAREQYAISVASAALAAARVESTRLELELGFPGVQARDFLEAQDAFRRALTAVADNHIGYIVDRTRFFLDLDLLQVDQSGMWPQLRDEYYQPVPQTEFAPNLGRPYGDIPEFLKVSDEIRRMLYIQ